MVTGAGNTDVYSYIRIIHKEVMPLIFNQKRSVIL